VIYADGGSGAALAAKAQQGRHGLYRRELADLGGITMWLMARRKRQDRGRLAKHAHNCGSFPSIRGEAEARHPTCAI
jgi:hypothetical protein